MFPNRRLPLSLLAALSLIALAIGVSACGYTSDEKEVAEGEPVELGNLHYNVVFSRFLNPDDNEDAAYLVGQEPAPEGSAYFGVFFEIQNSTNEAHPLPETLRITDADHQHYDVLPSESLYALPLGGEVEDQEQVPVLDSTPQQGPIEGSVAIFLLPPEASENRPLTLHIESPDGEEGEIVLDL